MKKMILCIVAMGLLLAGCSGKKAGASLSQLQKPKSGEQIAVIQTSMGDIKVKLFPDEAPLAVENFVTHAQNGYYDGIIFHRVIEDFMVQTGDPEGTGMGGESIWGEPFEDEFGIDLHHFRGALSLANSGPNTNGSQFFIVQASELADDWVEAMMELSKSGEALYVDNRTGKTITAKERFTQEVAQLYGEIGGTPYLDGGNPWPNIYGQYSGHTVFGQVFEGMDVVDKIAEVETSLSDKPLEDVSIITIEITQY